MSEWVRLGDVADISAGGTPARSKREYWENGTISWVKIGDITGKYLYSTEERISALGLKNSSAKVFPKGTILFSIFATLGAVTILKIEAATNQAIVGIQFNELVNQSYGYYFLQSLKDMVENKGRGVAQLNINQSILKNIKIPLLSQTEQQHIVSVLDTVNSLIDARKKQIALLDEAEKSLFVEMFGDSKHNPMNWKTVKLETLADVGSSKRVFVNQLQNVGIPFYRGTEIGLLAEKKEINPELFITNEHYEELINATGKPEIGDLLMPSICSDGRIWIVNHRTPFYFKDGRVLWVHKQDITKVDSCYLKYVLKEKIMTDYLSIASGTTFAELKIFALKALLVMLPPLSLQKEFAARISSIEDRRREMERGLQQMEEARSALMQQYFG